MNPKLRFTVILVVAAAVILVATVVTIVAVKFFGKATDRKVEATSATGQQRPPEELVGEAGKEKGSWLDSKNSLIPVARFEDILWGVDATPKLDLTDIAHQKMLQENVGNKVHERCQALQPFLPYLYALVQAHDESFASPDFCPPWGSIDGIAPTYEDLEKFVDRDSHYAVRYRVEGRARDCFWKRLIPCLESLLEGHEKPATERLTDAELQLAFATCGLDAAYEIYTREYLESKRMWPAFTGANVDAVLGLMRDDTRALALKLSQASPGPSSSMPHTPWPRMRPALALLGPTFVSPAGVLDPLDPSRVVDELSAHDFIETARGSALRIIAKSMRFIEPLALRLGRHMAQIGFLPNLQYGQDVIEAHRKYGFDAARLKTAMIAFVEMQLLLELKRQAFSDDDLGGPAVDIGSRVDDFLPTIIDPSARLVAILMNRIDSFLSRDSPGDSFRLTTAAHAYFDSLPDPQIKQLYEQIKPQSFQSLSDVCVALGYESLEPLCNELRGNQGLSPAQRHILRELISVT